MKNRILSASQARRATALALALSCALAALLLVQTRSARAAGWNSIEPLKSRRADVERILGRPLEDHPGQTGTLRFKVMGGIVTVTFVNARFIANKKLYPELEGTVLEIVLQHERSSETPETMSLTKNKDFTRQDMQGGSIFINQKDGITYTFLDGRLRTTRFSPAAEQLVRARKG
jgi:hypothetical protein